MDVWHAQNLRGDVPFDYRAFCREQLSTKSCVHAGNIFSTQAKQKVCLEVGAAVRQGASFLFPCLSSWFSVPCFKGWVCLSQYVNCKAPRAIRGRQSVVKGDIQATSIQNFSKGKNNTESTGIVGDGRHLNIAGMRSSNAMLWAEPSMAVTSPLSSTSSIKCILLCCCGPLLLSLWF